LKENCYWAIFSFSDGNHDCDVDLGAFREHLELALGLGFPVTVTLTWGRESRPSGAPANRAATAIRSPARHHSSSRQLPKPVIVVFLRRVSTDNE